METVKNSWNLALPFSPPPFCFHIALSGHKSYGLKLDIYHWAYFWVKNHSHCIGWPYFSNRVIPHEHMELPQRAFFRQVFSPTALTAFSTIEEITETGWPALRSLPTWAWTPCGIWCSKNLFTAEQIHEKAMLSFMSFKWSELKFKRDFMDRGK